MLNSVEFRRSCSNTTVMDGGRCLFLDRLTSYLIQTHNQVSISLIRERSKNDEVFLNGAPRLPVEVGSLY